MSLNFGFSYQELPGSFVGGRMEKDINMSGHNITNLPHPHGSKHAVRKKYVDDELSDKLDLGGGTMTGDIDMDDNSIKELAAPTENNDAATKYYVDTKSNEALRKDGTNGMLEDLDMNGFKIVNLANPTSNNDAVRKTYVDAKISSLPNESSFFIFEFLSAGRNSYTRARTQMANLFFTNDRDIKITFFAHVFDSDNSISNLDLYYKIIVWSKTKVQRSISFQKLNIREESTITGSWLQMYELNITKTITDIKCFTMEYKYDHTSSIGNESGLHCLIEYI